MTTHDPVDLERRARDILTAHKLGVAAATDPSATCPYDPGTTLAGAWRRGRDAGALAGA